MQKALVLAEKTAKETKDAAQLKAEAIEKDATKKAEQIVSEAEQAYDKLREKSLYLVQQFNQYKVQLKQVASAQLELITSDSFDVYSPELEAIQTEKKSLPETEIRKEEPPQESLEKTAVSEESPQELEFLQEESAPQQELLVEEPIIDDMVADEEPAPAEELDKTMVIPDVKKIASRKRPKPVEEDLDILTADTIDLSGSINQIREQTAKAAARPVTQTPKEAAPMDVQDALVLEPVDAVVTEPLDLTPVDTNQEVLEPKTESTKEAPTLDSLLQSINIGRKNKKKKGQDEDPFEFLGSVDDF